MNHKALYNIKNTKNTLILQSMKVHKIHKHMIKSNILYTGKNIIKHVSLPDDMDGNMASTYNIQSDILHGIKTQETVYMMFKQVPCRKDASLKHV